MSPLLETLPRRGYRFIAPVEVIFVAPGPAPIAHPVSPEAPAASEPPSIEASFRRRGRGGIRRSGRSDGFALSRARSHWQRRDGHLSRRGQRRGRQVALKFLPPKDPRPASTGSIPARSPSRERVNHPNICTVMTSTITTASPSSPWNCWRARRSRRCLLSHRSLIDGSAVRAPATIGHVARPRHPDCVGARGGARQGHHSPRHQARNIFLTTLGQARFWISA